MLSYILLFSLIAIIILGVIRASKQRYPGARHQKEPFVSLAQTELSDENEIVSKPRTISLSNKPATFTPHNQFAVGKQGADDNAITIKNINSKSGFATDTYSVDTTPPLFTASAKPEKKAASSGQDIINEVIILNILADHSRPYRGYELLQALLAIGLRYGKWNIFHRHQENTGRGPILFSLASIVEPGTFDLAKMGGFSTPGLTLFMCGTDLEEAGQALELLLSAAQQLADELGGKVCDEKHMPITAEKITRWRMSLT